MNTDPIADLLTRIRNAHRANHVSVEIPYSKAKEAVVKILVEEKFIDKYEIHDYQDKKIKAPKNMLKLFLKKGLNDLALVRVSKPGQRIYIQCSDIKPVKRGFGIRIISTNKGVMTGRSAFKQKVGGEVICDVY